MQRYCFFRKVVSIQTSKTVFFFSQGSQRPLCQDSCRPTPATAAVFPLSPESKSTEISELLYQFLYRAENQPIRYGTEFWYKKNRGSETGKTFVPSYLCTHQRRYKRLGFCTDFVPCTAFCTVLYRTGFSLLIFSFSPLCKLFIKVKSTFGTKVQKFQENLRRVRETAAKEGAWWGECQENSFLRTGRPQKKGIPRASHGGDGRGCGVPTHAFFNICLVAA